MDDLARRLAARGPRHVLELACGICVLTRAMARTLARDMTIVATEEPGAAGPCGRPVPISAGDRRCSPFMWRALGVDCRIP